MKIGLKLGALGAEVQRLHRALSAAGHKIEPGEAERGEFGPATLNALRDFQRQRGMPEREETDEDTCSALLEIEKNITINIYESGPPPKPEKPNGDAGIVRGTLVDGDGAPIADAKVSLSAKHLRSETHLGDATTDKQGQYSIAYNRPSALNLVVRSYDASQKVVAQSATVFAAPAQVRINLTTAPSEVVRPPSTFTALDAAIAAQLEDTPLRDLRENKDTHELHFLSSALGVQFDEVAYIFIAHVLGAKNGIRATTFFGIFYEGVPAPLDAALTTLPDAGVDDAFMAQVLSGVLAHARGSLSHVLTTAVNANVLPASYAAAQDSELNLLDALRTQNVGSTPYIRGKTSLNDLLAAGSVVDAVKTAFTQAYADNAGQLGPTWKTLRANKSLSVADLAALNTTLSAGELLTGNLPLINDTLRRLSQKTLASLHDLALLDESDWVVRIAAVDPQATSIPQVLPADTPQQRIARFAKALAARFAGRYPTTAFAGGLSKTSASSFASKDELISVLTANPTLSFKHSNIDQFIATNKVAISKPAMDDLKAAQRLFRISPHYASVEALKSAGHTSAQSVYFKGRGPFLAEMTPVLGSASLAEMAYARAHMTYATALMAFGRYNLAINGLSVAALGSAAPDPSALTNLPDLQALFGSQDFFQCEDCQSVYSPAAYLVDLLQYLCGFPANGGGVANARDALFLRRPEIQYIVLDCNNTNITLPYIDLVNEVLETAIAPPATPVTLIDTTGTSAERRALPQNTSQAAYVKTAGAVFPLLLPFDVAFAQTTAYLAALGVTRAGILTLFAGAPLGPDSATLACATLEINPTMQRVINGTDAHQPWDRWGLAQNPARVMDPKTRVPYSHPSDWVAALSKVPVLLNRASLSLQQLYQLLQVVWVTQSGVTLQPGTTTSAGVQILSPDMDLMIFTGLTADVLDRANRFLRLWAVAGLQMWELDWALEPAPGHLDNAFLAFLSGAMAVQNKLNLPFQEVLSFWMPMETRDVTNHLGDEDATVPSTYSEVFRNPAVLASWSSVFVAPGSLSGAAILPSNVNAITAALGLSADDISAILAFTGAANTLSLATLNVLLQYQRLSSSLSLGIPGLIQWIQLTDSKPFNGAPADTLEFCRRLAVLQGTGLAAGDIDYLLRNQSASGSSLAFTPPQATVVLQSVRDAVAKLRGAIVIPITGASDTAPIAIGTASPHGLQTGTQVSVSGALGNTAANGRFTITVTSSTSFTLDGSAGNGLWANGGAVGFLAAASIPIAAVSNASPIAITTASPHGQQTGGQVSISGALGNTAANGTFTITATSPTSFNLNGSTGNGVWTSGGIVAFLTATVDGTTVETIFVNALATATGTTANIVTPVLLKTGVLPLEPISITLLLAQNSGVDPAQFPELIQAFTAVAKAAALFTALKPTETAFAFVVQNAGTFNWLDPSALPLSPVGASPYTPFEALLRALSLDQRQSARTPKLFDILAQWLPPNPLPADVPTAVGGPPILIIAASNISPIAITTASPHGLQTGMQVTIGGVVGNTAANGAFTITVTGPATFTLNGTTGNGVWTGGGSVVAAGLACLALALNASVSDVLAIAGQLGATPPSLTPATLPGSLADIAMLASIAGALDVLARYGISGTTLVQLAAIPAIPDTASAAMGALQAQYAQSAWFGAIQPVEDTLRQNRRDAMVAYLLGPGPAAPTPPLLTTDDIFNYYLIDPEMSPCALMTRLLQASLAIQQFMQQCFLNLFFFSSTVTIEMSNAQLCGEWSWRQQYRLWQANREVFLYPENYVLPELRTNASSFFTDLENDLRQSNCDADAAEAALENYLRKLVGVGRLQVAAHYNQNKPDGSTVLHVFAHTSGTPQQWYYRARTQMTPGAGSWSAWTSLNLDIAPSQHLLPVVWDRRLHLVWPIFKQISERQSDQSVPAGGGSTQSAPRKFWTVEFAMSELSAGQWQAKRTIGEKVFLDTTDCPLAFTFRACQDSTFNLQLQVYWVALEEAIDVAKNMAVNSSINGENELVAALANAGMTAAAAILSAAVSALVPPPLGLLVAAADATQIVAASAPPAGQATASVLSSTATVQLSWVNQGGYTPAFTVLDTSGTSTLIANATLPMPESPLSVVEVADAKPDSHYVDLSQEPTFALVQTGTMSGQLATPAQYGFSGQDLVYGNYTLKNPGQQPLYVFCTTTSKEKPVNIPLLGTIENPRVVIPPQEPVFDSADPFFVADPTRTYLVQPQYYTVSSAPLELFDLAYISQWSTKYVFKTFYHPYARTFLRELEIGGVSQLMARSLQVNPQGVREWTPTFDFNALYNPQPPVAKPYPGVPGAPDPGESALDFATGSSGAFSLYNWEVFYHVPMFVASLLMQNQQYQDALTWLEYIFNPTDSSGGPSPQRFWQMAPFNTLNKGDWINQEIQNILTQLAADTQQGIQGISDQATLTAIQNWVLDPFDPHTIASLRIGAYGKATVMKFLDNLIAWGDWYYNQYTAEKVSQAEQLYILADMILGPPPQMLRLPNASQSGAGTTTYSSLKNIDAFSNVLVNIENVIAAPEPPQAIVKGTAQTPSLPLLPCNGSTLLFCIPPNGQLLAYWDTVSQRLYNIRHCLNLQGVAQPLPLYAPPINPLQLIEAEASGSSFSSATPAAPIYRFATYLQKAVELTNDVRAYGALILSALEKQDAETLAVLRANQELDIQTRMLDVKNLQATEAQDQVTALTNQKAVVQIRYNFYSKVAFMNAWEITAIALQGAALIANGVGLILDMTSGVAHMVPSYPFGTDGFGGTPTVIADFGGENVGEATTSWASVARGIAGLLSEAGGMAATIGGYQRRMDEWNLQAQMAGAELTQIDSQITAATDRLSIASKEVDIQNAQISNAQAVSDFLTNKYTNAKLYNWMVTQLTTVYTQAYQLAFSLALQAQNAYQYELGSQNTFIQFGYWDSQHKGLTAGESLLFDLRRMEAQYFDENSRELELTKHVSLALTDPMALVMLRETGTCPIALNEILFESDHPGQYFRRLRSVALTIPCVTGPYTGVNATLSLTNAMLRTQAPGTSYKPFDFSNSQNDPTVISSPLAAAGTQTIATSSGQNDAGLFDANLRDERWLPFEGQGAISSWSLVLDPRDNKFDFSTITDVVLHVRFTARGGGDLTAAGKVRAALKALQSKTDRSILVSVRHTFGDAYYSFFNPADTTATQQTLNVPFSNAIFPFSNLGNPQIKDINVLLVPTLTGASIPATFGPTGGASSKLTLAGNASLGLVLAGDFSLAPPARPESFTLTVPQASVPASLGVMIGGVTRLDPSKIEDILLIVSYSIV